MRRRRDPAAPPPDGSPKLAALTLLGRRDYTARELTRRLLDRGYNADDVQSAIAQLVADGTINDRRTAAAHARTSSRVKARGRSRIARELEARGVPADAIRDAVAQVTDEDEDALLRAQITKATRGAPLSPDERRRLFQRLLRRGFSSTAIGRALRARPDDGDDE